jgi:hypothetical protein
MRNAVVEAEATRLFCPDRDSTSRTMFGSIELTHTYSQRPGSTRGRRSAAPTADA